MRDFDDVVRDSLAAREAAVASASPGPGLTATLSAIRRRRRRRHTGEAFAAVGAAATLVVVLVVGGGDATQHPVAPTGTPSPSATSSPAPSPSPSSTSAVTPEPTSAPRRPRSVEDLRAAGYGLPTGMVPVTDEVWARTGEGWLLVVARPERGKSVVFNSLVLVSPEGASYLISELPKDVVVTLQHWEPGSTRALVTVEPVVDGYTQRGMRGWLDVRSGAVTTDAGGLEVTGDDPATPAFVGIDHRGRELWVEHEVSGDGTAPGTLVVLDDGDVGYRLDLGTGWGGLLLDPNARTLVTATDPLDAYRVIDLDAGSVKTYPFGGWCDLVGWTGETHVLTICEGPADRGGGVPLWDLADLRVGAEQVTALPSSDRVPEYGPGAWLSGHGTVVPFVDQPWLGGDRPTGVAAFAQDGSSTVLPVELARDDIASVRSADGRAYVDVSRWSSSGWDVSVWSGADATTLIRIPEGTHGMTSWIVAGDQDGPS